MVVPEDLFALVALRTKNRIESVAAEYPGQTRLEYLGEKQKDTHVYQVYCRATTRSWCAGNRGADFVPRPGGRCA